MAMEIKEYEIYAGIGSTDGDVTLIDKIELSTDEEARDYAEYCAFGLYNLNPERDIFDIMDEENVDEDEALEIFYKEASEKTISFAVEYNVDAHGNKFMTKHY